MKKKLLDYIVCTDCKAQFDLKTENTENLEVISGTLRCVSCGREFPIVGGIPRFLSADLSEEKKDTAEAFGYEWKHFTALTDKYKGQFLDWIAPVTEDFFRDKVVLDAGCGKGRHVWLASHFGSKEVIGVDLSEAAEVAYANTGHLPNVHIVQGDIYELPFLDSFDYIYSIGVLHHLPDPKKGFLALIGHLKHGGRISAWVYGKEGNWWIEKIVNPIRLGVTSQLPKIVTKVLSFIVAVPLQLVLKLIYRPINLYLKPISKFLFYNDYLFSISNFSFEENFSIVFDHLIAPTAFYISRAEFEKWFSDGQLSDVNISWRNRNSWRGKASKI